MITYDAIIIGSGQGGTPLAKKLANAGWKTAIIEKRLIGGTCINDGCTPTKTMIASARIAHLARHSKQWGVDVEDVRVDLPAIVERKNKLVLTFREGSTKGLEQTENLDILWGEASLTGEKKLKVTSPDGSSKDLTAGHIFINTGTRPFVPENIEGITSFPYLTSHSILDLQEIPGHLVIIGGNYIGLEFGQMFRRFGSQVTVVETNSRLLRNEDEDVADVVRNILEDEEIHFLMNAHTKSVSGVAGNATLSIDVNGSLQSVACTHILLAAGRVPQTDALNLEAAGVIKDKRGYIPVNGRLETNVKGIYALGDVKGGPAFTHISYNDYIVIIENLLEKAGSTIEGRMVPYCMFIDPQLGRVGITETEARSRGLDIKVATYPMANVARALETGETKGIMKAVVDKASAQILGVAIVGTEGGEVMSVLQMAMMGGITYHTIRKTIFAHPLFSESLNNLFMTLDK